MTDLENLNESSYKSYLENITDEQAKKDIIFSQESMREQKVDDKKGRTFEEIKAELEPMNKKELGDKISTVIKQYNALIPVINKNENDINVKDKLKNWLNEQIKILEIIKRDYEKHNYTELSVYKTRICQYIYNLENFNEIYDITASIKTTDNYTTRDEKRIKKYKSLDAEYKKEINDIIYGKAISNLIGNF